MQTKVFRVLNSLLLQYSELGLSKLFLQPLQFEIVQISKKQFRLINDQRKIVPGPDLLCIKEDQFVLVKIHSKNMVDKIEGILQSDGVIIIHTDGLVSSNGFAGARKRGGIKAVLIGISQAFNFNQLDCYLTGVQIYKPHLNIQCLSYSSSQLYAADPWFSTFLNLQLLEEYQSEVFYRVLNSSAKIPDFEDVANKIGNGSKRQWGDFHFSFVEQEFPPSFWIYRNSLPFLDTFMDLAEMPTVLKHLKFIKRNAIGHVEAKLKSKYEGKSFICIINIQFSGSPEDFKKDLDQCMKQLFKQMQLNGWRSTRQLTIQEQFEHIQDLCRLLGVSDSPLIRKLLI